MAQHFPVWTAPLIGAVIGGILSSFNNTFGNDHRYFEILAGAGLGFVGGGTLLLMNLIERGRKSSKTFNPRITRLLLFLTPLTFWVPLIGLLHISYASYRAKYLKGTDWKVAPVGCLFFVAIAINLCFVIIVILKILGIH